MRAKDGRRSPVAPLRRHVGVRITTILAALVTVVIVGGLGLGAVTSNGQGAVDSSNGVSDLYPSGPADRIIASLDPAGIFGGAHVASAAPRPPREQRMPATAFNSHKDDKRFVVVYVEDRGAGSNLYAKKLFNNGLPQGGPSVHGWEMVRVSPGPRRDKPGPRENPAIEFHGGNREFLLVYDEYRGEPDGWDVYSVRVSTAGYSRTRPRLIAGGPGDQRRPDVARSGEGYLVVWDDNTRDLDEVWGIRVRSNGIQIGKPTRYASPESWNASDPTTNGSVVAWEDDRDVDTDIWAIRVANGLPRGVEYRLAGTEDDDLSPRFSGVGLVWNTYDPASGNDIQGARVYANNLTRGRNIGILVPAADQSWPDGANGVLVFSDNRTGEYDLYAVRTNGNLYTRGREYPVIIDYEP